MPRPFLWGGEGLKQKKIPRPFFTGEDLTKENTKSQYELFKKYDSFNKDQYIELAEYCKVNKIKSLGLADSFNLCGALEFSEKLSKVGTQPIIGTQINIKHSNISGKITLYAKTENGYKNLTKLSSLSYLKGKDTEEPNCKIEDIIENSDDLILLTGNYRDFFGKLF